MRRNIHRQWVMLVREDNGLATWVFEPLRRKEISVRLKRGWKRIG